jgi:hypothetical protein
MQTEVAYGSRGCEDGSSRNSHKVDVDSVYVICPAGGLDGVL